MEKKEQRLIRMIEFQWRTGKDTSISVEFNKWMQDNEANGLQIHILYTHIYASKIDDRDEETMFVLYEEVTQIEVERRLMMP